MYTYYNAHLDQVRDAALAEVHRRRHAGLLVEVNAYHQERMLSERLPARRALLGVPLWQNWDTSSSGQLFRP